MGGMSYITIAIVQGKQKQLYERNAELPCLNVPKLVQDATTTAAWALAQAVTADRLSRTES